MAEQLQNKCPHCGYPIETAEHAPDCPNVKVETESPFESREQVSDKSETEIFIEQINREEEMSKQTIKIVKQMQEMAQITAAESQSGVIDYSSLLKPELVKQKLDSMEAEAKKLAQEFKQIISDEANSAVDKIRNMKITGEESWRNYNESIRRVSNLIETAQEKYAQLSHLANEANSIWAQYKQASLDRAGFANFEDLETEQESFTEESRGIRGMFLGRLRHWKRYSELSQKIGELWQVGLLKNQNYEPERVGRGKERADIYSGSIRRDLDTVANESVNAIISRFRELFYKEADQLSRPESQAEKNQWLDDETRQSLAGDYAGMILEDWLAKDTVLSSQIQPETIDSVKGIIEKAQAIGFNLHEYGGKDEHNEAVAQVEKMLGSLPLKLQKSLKYHLYNEHDKAKRTFDDVADFIKRDYEGFSRERIAADLYERVLKQLESIQVERSGYSIPRERDDLRSWRLNKDVFDAFVQNLDMRMWATFIQNKKVAEIFGQNELIELDKQMLQDIMRKIIDSRGSADNRVNLGFNLMNYKTPESVQLFVVNAFTESGYQDQRPFIGYNAPSRESELFKYVTALTPEQINKLRQANMPEAVEIIELIRANPDTFNAPKLRETKEQEEEDIKDNPVHARIKEQLLNIGLKYLREIPEMQLYVLGMLSGVKGDLSPEAYEEIEKMINNPVNDDVERRLPLFMLGKIKQGDSRIAKMWMDNPMLTRLNLKYWRDPILAMAEKERDIPVLLETLDRLDKAEGESGSYRRKYTDHYFESLLKSDEPEGEKRDITPEQYEEFNGKLDYLIKQGEKDVFDRRALKFVARHPDKAGNLIKLAQKGLFGPGMGGNEEEIFNNIEKLAGDDEKLKKIIVYMDQVSTKTEEGERYRGYNFSMISDVAIRFIADHPDKIEAPLELKKLGMFKGAADFASRAIFEKAEALLLDEENYKKFKKYITAAKNKAEPAQMFLFNALTIDKLAKKIGLAGDLLDLSGVVKFDDGNFRHFIVSNLEKILSYPKEKREAYVNVFAKIQGSPSQEIQRVRDQILNQILATKDPESTYKQIEDIFIKNNLPMVGKVFRVFQILHPPEQLKAKVERNAISPVLRKSGQRRRYYTIYQDLLKVHIESGNRSLKEYLESLQQGQQAMEALERTTMEKLKPSELERVKFFLAKMETLYSNSQLGHRSDAAEIESEGDVRERYQKLRQSLGVKEGQSVNDRVVEMFVKPAGYDKLDDVLSAMRQAKEKAHQRSLDTAAQAKDGRLELKPEDLLKGVDTRYISNILQNGSVAKEYLGASADSDMTPFDTDLSRVMESDTEKEGFQGAVEYSIAQGYGNLLFAVKNRGQWQETDSENVGSYDNKKYELFNSGGGKHFGIRTGFPTTEIDFMIAQDNLIDQPQELEKIFFEIAKGGFYIPITNKEGNLIFTPEMFRTYQEAFEGIDRFDGPALDVIPTAPDDPQYIETSRLVKVLRRDREQVDKLSVKIREIISGALSKHGIELKSEFDTSIVGSELADTGSTGRHTNMPGEYDFDLTIKLDDADFGKVDGIIGDLKNALKPDPKKMVVYGKEEGHRQLRAFGSTTVGNKPIDIDVGFVRKSELAVFGSHDAITEKLNWIRTKVGEDEHEQVVANIIHAKQVLKEGGAYKKLEHGGLGGIGVENWILLHGGNIMQAFRTFREAAYEGDSRVSLNEFRRRYKILDAGINVQKIRHDNYTHNLTESGFQAILEVIDKYLGKK